MLMSNILEQVDSLEKQVKRIAQALSFGADVSSEDPCLVVAAKVLLTDYVPQAPTPSKVYVGPHVPGYGLNYW